MSRPGVILAACLLLAACAAPAVCSAPQKVAEIALRPFGLEEIVPVRLNGQPANLILDTGDTWTAFSARAVERLGLSSYPTNGFLVGAGGRARAEKVDVARLDIAGKELRNGHFFVVRSSAAFARGGSVVDGALGIDILANWDLDLDIPHDRLTLFRPQRCDDPAPPWPLPHQTVASLSASIRTHQMLIPVDLDRRKLAGLIDTGAETTVASVLAIPDERIQFSHDRLFLSAGIGSRPEVGRLHRFSRFGIDGVDYGPAAVVVSPLVYPWLHGTDIVIGEDFLHHHRVYLAFWADKTFIGPADPADAAGPLPAAAKMP